MTISLNNQKTELPADVTTVAELAEWKGIKREGTAFAINNRIVLARNWEIKKLEEGDQVTVISAAFGG